MVSSSLTFLRGLPQEQADTFNTYLPAAGKIRLTYQWSVAQPKIADLASNASDSLQSLLERATSAEGKIRKAAIPAGDATESACSKARYALIDRNMDLSQYCQVLIADGDRDGFAGLRSELALIIAATRPGVPIEKARKDALDSITPFERQLFTADEQDKLDEVQECDISIPLVVRNAKGLDNFSVLLKYFADQQTSAAYQGSAVRPVRLYSWLGLPGSPESKTAYIRLEQSESSEIGRPNVAGPNTTSNTGSNYDSYMVRR